MATFISLHIKSENRNQIAKILQDLSEIEEITTGKYPIALNENILLDENANPSFMAIGNIQNGWTTVQLNSFKKLHNWSKKISTELDTTTIHIIGQTVSDVYYFLMYDGGKLRREIEIYHGDFENITDKGNKFLFENKSLVPLNDEDYSNLFESDTLEKYCKEFGFDLFYDIEPDFYFILKNKKIGSTINDYAKSHSKTKPWWKFW